MGRTALRVCTIEDDAVDRMMIHRLLDQDPTWKVEFAEFATGRDAIENLPEADVDVILLDSRIDRAEGEIAGPLGLLAKDFPDLSIGSYPFQMDGAFGANIVLRGTDTTMIDTAAQRLIDAFPDAIV